MNLILFGFKGCGKTYFGKRLAEETGAPFIDSDALIEKELGLSCREIYQLFGEKFFRIFERRIIASLGKTKDSIIAIGGGAILDIQNQTLLENIGQLVYLEISKDILKSRLLSQQLPSFFNKDDPEGSFENMYQQRKPLYEAIPAIKVSLHEKNDGQVLQTLKGLYG